MQADIASVSPGRTLIAPTVEAHPLSRRITTMSQTSPLQPTVVRLPVDMHRAIRERAEAEDRTMAQTIRRAVKQYLATDDQ